MAYFVRRHRKTRGYMILRHTKRITCWPRNDSEVFFAGWIPMQLLQLLQLA